MRKPKLQNLREWYILNGRPASTIPDCFKHLYGRPTLGGAFTVYKHNTFYIPIRNAKGTILEQGCIPAYAWLGQRFECPEELTQGKPGHKRFLFGRNEVNK